MADEVGDLRRFLSQAAPQPVVAVRRDHNAAMRLIVFVVMGGAMTALMMKMHGRISRDDDNDPLFQRL